MANSNTANENNITEQPTVQATVRLPESLWSAVRKRAIDERTSAQQIVHAALRKHMDADAAA